MLNEHIHIFLHDYFKSDLFKILPLAGDASARKYFRISFESDTFVLMSWEPFDADKYPFISVLKHFEANNIHVPQIKKVGASEGLLLLEDLGDLTLERKFWESQTQERSWDFYQKSLDQIIKIHTTATQSNKPTVAKNIMFDTAKFLWELNYAKEHLLEGLLKINFDSKMSANLEKAYINISEKLHAQPKVICHRDYHSRNLMIKFDKVFVIDFQDARLGPIQYDLVSLIKDSYVDISDAYAEQMLKYYFDHTNFLQDQKMSRDQFNEIFQLQSIQRCFKACGSFASFMNARGDKRYLKYLTPTLKRVAHSLSYFPQYKILNDILSDSGAFDKNYESF